MEFVATNSVAPPAGPPVDWPAWKAEVISRLDVAAEYEALGVEFTRPSANSKGIRECRAFGREDSEPSAFVNVKAGVYHDSGGDGSTTDLFGFALRHGNGRWGKWIEVAKHYGERAGVPLGPVRFGSKGKILEAVYRYHDADGHLVFGVHRYRLPSGDKTFRQYPWRNGDWFRAEGCMDGVPLYPYRLPELLGAASGEPVWICYSPDTEVLTSDGWVPFPKLHWQDEVAQYDPASAEITFANPLAIQRFDYDGPMVHIKSLFSDLLVTPDHRMLVKYEKCRPKVVPASEVVRSMYLPVAGRLSDLWRDRYPQDLRSASPDPGQTRLLVAFAADGIVQRGFRIAWNLKKSRKVERLRSTLIGLGIGFRERSFPSCPEWTLIDIDRRDAPWLLEFMPEKMWHWGCLDWTGEAREVALRELQHWDGDSTGDHSTRFFTAKKDEADTVAAVACLSGWGVTIREDRRENRPEQATQYVLNLNDKDWRTLGETPRPAPPVGEVWCCTVPTGFIVVRRNGKVTVAGNCEGEKDVERARALGLVATCNPMGAGKWRSEFDEYLRGRACLVVPDADPTGRSHAARVAASLRAVARSVKVVELPGLPYHGDLSDWLDSGGTADELWALAGAAPEWEPGEAGAKPGAAEAEDLSRDATVADLRLLMAVESWVWPLWIPQAALTLVAAEAGTGKTRFCFDLARRTWYGTRWPDESPIGTVAGGKTLWVVADNQWQEMCDVAADFGIPDEAVVLNSSAADPYAGTSLQTEEELADLEARIRRVRPALVIIDTITNTTDWKAQDVAEAKKQYKPLQEIASRCGVAIVCVTHLNASGHVLGRRATEKVRVVIQISCPDPEGQPDRRKLWVEKSKARKPEALGVTMGDAGNEYDHQPPEAPDPGRMNGARRGPVPEKTRAAMAWLEERLRLGPARVSQVRREAEAEGIAVGTLYNARDALKVEEDTIDERKWWRLQELQNGHADGQPF